jgi:arginyl-tRNA--protein-N-Asp/Glu arginylyltransferase
MKKEILRLLRQSIAERGIKKTDQDFEHVFNLYQKYKFALDQKLQSETNIKEYEKQISDFELVILKMSNIIDLQKKYIIVDGLNPDSDRNKEYEILAVVLKDGNKQGFIYKMYDDDLVQESINVKYKILLNSLDVFASMLNNIPQNENVFLELKKFKDYILKTFNE